jgi:hypothetical protein
MGASAAAYCQNCGKALCPACVCSAAAGQILCAPCWTAWQRVQQPFVPGSSCAPNPAAAAVLGLIPGVGAMYNCQFFKGLIHVVIFATLVSITEFHGIFGIFVGAWCLYQSFEAYHTAQALRTGQPPPDPLGLNEVGNWLHLGSHPRTTGATGPVASNPVASNPVAGGYSQPDFGAYQSPYVQVPGPAAYAPPAAGFAVPAGIPIPPAPPFDWRHREPVGAVVLIALGLLFLLSQLDIFHGRLIEFAWPLGLIALGVWLIVRRLSHSQGGSQ